MAIIWWVLGGISLVTKGVLVVLDLLLENQKEVSRYRPIDDQHGYDN